MLYSYTVQVQEISPILQLGAWVHSQDMKIWTVIHTLIYPESWNLPEIPTFPNSCAVHRKSHLSCASHVILYVMPHIMYVYMCMKCHLSCIHKVHEMSPPVLSAECRKFCPILFQEMLIFPDKGFVYEMCTFH